MARWDHLYDLKPRATVEVLLDEAAKAFAEELGRWPPPLEAAAGVGPSLQAVLAGPRPHPSVYREALQLVRLDLLREYDELDRWEREELWKKAQLTPAEKDAAVFLWRYVGEQIFGLNETVQSRLTRAQLVGLVDRLELRLSAPSLILPR